MNSHHTNILIERIAMGITNILKTPIKYFIYLNRKRKFGSIGKHTSIGKPLRITCPENIFLDDFVGVAPYAWLAAEPHGMGMSSLIIKKGCRIGDFAHIYATNEIVIEENVLLANFVYISDTDHGYKDIYTDS